MGKKESLTFDVWESISLSSNLNARSIHTYMMSSSASTSAASPVADALKASAGGLFALCALYPLDLLRTKRAAEASTSSDDDDDDDVDDDDGAKKTTYGKKNSSSNSKSSGGVFREIALTVHEKGVSELYRGFYPRAVHCLISDLIYYYSYTYLTNRKLESLMLEIAKKKDAPAPENDGDVNIIDISTSVRLGTIAGIVTNILTIPVDTVSMNLQISKSTKRLGIFEITRKIYEEHGIVKFWNGLLPGCILTVNPAINVALFENMKARYLLKYARENKMQLSAFEAFVLGTVSKGAATVITYPMIRLKTLLLKANEDNNEDDTKKVEADVRKKKATSVMNVIKAVLEREGISGFYRGIYVQLLRSTSGSGLMFMVREALR